MDLLWPGEACGFFPTRMMLVQRQTIILNRKPKIQIISRIYPYYEYFLKLGARESPDELDLAWKKNIKNASKLFGQNK